MPEPVGTATASFTVVRIQSRRTAARGSSLIELLVVLGIFSITAGISLAAFFSSLSRPNALDGASKELVAKFKLARVLSISRDTHYRIEITGAQQYAIERLTFDGVSNAWTNQNTDVRPQQLPSSIGFGATSPIGLAIEFDGRGTMIRPGSAVTLNLQDTTLSLAKGVRVLPSGQVQLVAGSAY